MSCCSLIKPPETNQLQEFLWIPLPQRSSDVIYDLIIGNVPGARPTKHPDSTWQEVCAVTTRTQAKKDGEVNPLKVLSSQESTIVDKEKLKQMQRDESLHGPGGDFF